MQDFLDTRQLRAFAALARCGSFTEAAGELSLTQSAVSHSMKALEDDLGSRLFHRSGKRVLLTQAGKELLSHAEAILRRMVQARDAISALEQSPRGRLRIGCSTAAAQYILLMVLREFRDCFPLYNVTVLPGETPETMQRLRDGVIDLSISLKPHETNGLTCQPIFSDELELLVAPTHRWVKAKPKAPDLALETLIVTSRQSYTYELVTNHLLSQGVRATAFIELGSSEAMKQFVKLGLGSAVAAPWSAVQEIERGELISIPMPRGPLRRDWVVSSLEDRPLNLAEQTFVGLCTEAGKKF
jgi:DNA-binding transcriptional LysR family regulator